MNRELIETELTLKLPHNFENYDETTQNLIISYLKQLNKIEQLAYTIGLQHLGSSFNIVKSNGFISWNKTLK